MAIDHTAANKRRFLFGAKGVLDITLMLIVVGFAVWAAGRFGGQRDLSSSGVNSLSSRTQNLLDGVDQELTITGLYSLALSEIRPFADKHRGRVADLLDLYDTAGRDRVTTAMIDPAEEPGRLRSLLDRLQAKPKYQAEALPYQEALAKYPALAESIARLFQEEKATLTALLAEQPALQQVRELTVIDRNLTIVLEEAEAVQAAVEELQVDDIPRYGQALNAIGSHFDQVAKALTVARDWMGQGALEIPGLSEQARAYFAGAVERYTPVLDGIEALRDASLGLEPLELEQAYEQLKAGSVVVVETDTAVRVLPLDDVWPIRTDRRPAEDGDRREFAGEQAVSSAILQMTQKERTAVVFVRFAGGPLLQPDLSQMPQMGGQMPQAPYGAIGAALQKENFLTAEWDLDSSPTPPEVEDAARTIYVVFPPTDPGPQALRNPAGAKSISEEQIAAVEAAVEQAGTAIFLAGWKQTRLPIPGQGGYAYDDYLREQWGIGVDGERVVIPFQLNPRKTEAYIPVDYQNPSILPSGPLHFTEHPIVKPLQSLPAALTEVTPLEVLTGESAVEGVTHAAIAEVPEGSDAWAIKNVMRLQEDFNKFEGTRLYPDDKPSPFPVAIAAERGEARVVVFASERFLSNGVLEAARWMMVSGGLVMAQLYPANRDLFINTLHWLTGDADRIAVGPSRGQVPRLEKLKEEQAEVLPYFLVGVWPALALVAGAVVWFVRRR